MKQTLLLLIGLALVATACGGEGDDEVSAAPSIVVEGADSSGPAEEETVSTIRPRWRRLTATEPRRRPLRKRLRQRSMPR